MSDHTRKSIAIVIIQLILIASTFYCLYKGYGDLRTLFAAILIVVSAYSVYRTIRYKRIVSYIEECAKFVNIIDNIVKVTAMNCFYAKKLQYKFDIEKIERELSQDELEIIAVPEMFYKEEKASDEEIEKSIQYMKDWNIGVIHRVLLTSLTKGFITGEQRKLLLNHGLAGINNINDDTFVFDKRIGDRDFYKMSLVFEDESDEVL